MAQSTKTRSILRGGTRARDAAQASRELHAQIFQENAALTVFFASPQYDLETLAKELAGLFGDTLLVGCTTAGEISPQGYCQGSLAGWSLSGKDFRVSTTFFHDLESFEFSQGTQAAQALVDEVNEGTQSSEEKLFAFLLTDGLSMLEEALVSSIYQGLAETPLCGGSAGDGTRFEKTFVYADGQFHSNAAMLMLVATERPFHVFKTEHFVSTKEKMVVTDADPVRRIVREINGLPAGEEYARLVGLETAQLSPLIFATYPVVVRIGGRCFVRSIQQVNEDGSLTFFCAIDAGIVLTIADGVDIIENLQGALNDVKKEVGEPELIIGCDCILRSLELDQTGIKEQVAQLLEKHNVVGFSTYGEQYNSTHVNQTFTGIAIGS